MHMTQNPYYSVVLNILPDPLENMQVGAAQAGRADAHDHGVGGGNLRLVDLLDLQVDVHLLVVRIQSGCFHGTSLLQNTSCSLRSRGSTKRAPGIPHSRKKSPVARHSATLTALPA